MKNLLEYTLGESLKFNVLLILIHGEKVKFH